MAKFSGKTHQQDVRGFSKETKPRPKYTVVADNEGKAPTVGMTRGHEAGPRPNMPKTTKHKQKSSRPDWW